MFKKGRSYTYRGVEIKYSKKDNMYHVDSDIKDLSPDYPATKKHVTFKRMTVMDAILELDTIV